MATTVDSTGFDQILAGTDKKDVITTTNYKNYAKNTFYIDGRGGDDMLYLNECLGGAVFGGDGDDFIVATSSGEAQILGEKGIDNINAFLNKESVSAYGGDDDDVGHIDVEYDEDDDHHHPDHGQDRKMMMILLTMMR